MADPHLQRQLDEIVRDLDLLAFRLEQPPATPDDPAAERAAVRRELHRLIGRLRDATDRVG
jgi:hypothetical protein